jgi:hypothetical protein
MSAVITLKQALEAGKLDQFIAEHDGETGDQEVLEATIRAMAGTSREAPPTSHHSSAPSLRPSGIAPHTRAMRSRGSADRRAHLHSQDRVMPQFLTWHQFVAWKTNLLTNAALAGPEQHKFALARAQQLKRRVKSRLTKPLLEAATRASGPAEMQHGQFNNGRETRTWPAEGFTEQGGQSR